MRYHAERNHRKNYVCSWHVLCDRRNKAVKKIFWHNSTNKTSTKSTEKSSNNEENFPANFSDTKLTTHKNQPSTVISIDEDSDSGRRLTIVTQIKVKSERVQSRIKLQKKIVEMGIKEVFINEIRNESHQDTLNFHSNLLPKRQLSSSNKRECFMNFYFIWR